MKKKHGGGGSRPANTTNLNIRISPELLELIEEAAAADERSVSAWVRLTLRKAAEQEK